MLKMLYLSSILKYSVFGWRIMDFSYKFPVVAGIQAGKKYYIAMVPLRMISKLFPDEEEYVSPEYRAQRKLNESRIPIISKYITDNRDSYVFSALAASIDGMFEFHENSEASSTGILEVSMDAKFLINDGQHRKAAIIDALKEDETLGDETISVVLYEDLGLARSQQIFTDLNKHAVKTSNSISELYDSRDEVAVINRNVVSSVKFIDDFTDKERDILGKYSSNLFTLNTFYLANKRIIGNCKKYDKAEKFLKKFWREVAKNITEWNELENKKMSKVDLRENYLITQSVIIQALGIVGNYFFINDQYHANEYLRELKTMDWRRNAIQWKLRVVRADGRIMTSNKAIILAANVIKKHMGIPLSDSEECRENEFIKSITI